MCTNYIDHILICTTEFARNMRYGEQLLKINFYWLLCFLKCLFRYFIPLHTNMIFLNHIFLNCKELHNICWLMIFYTFWFIYFKYLPYNYWNPLLGHLRIPWKIHNISLKIRAFYSKTNVKATQVWILAKCKNISPSLSIQTPSKRNFQSKYRFFIYAIY